MSGTVCSDEVESSPMSTGTASATAEPRKSRRLSRKNGLPERVRKTRKKKRRSGNNPISEVATESSTQEKKDELFIGEILKKPPEKGRTTYEEPLSPPRLTTDTIYIQGRNGFSAVKMREAKSHRTRKWILGESRDGRSDFPEGTSTRHLRPPIVVAIAAQNFWKSSALIYQGLLGGMAFMHLIVVQVFFDVTAEPVVNYSKFSEIYANLFSFLIVLSVLSVFDKFDLARLDLRHFQEIRLDHAKTAILVPLYFLAFCLHQASSKDDDRLASMHYEKLNGTTSNYTGNWETFITDAKSWQRITVSKDLLVVLAWLLAALGERDDMLLTHLRSMRKYVKDIENPLPP